MTRRILSGDDLICYEEAGRGLGVATADRTSNKPVMEKWRMTKCKLASFASLAFLIACTRVQPPLKIAASPLITPIISHEGASGCEAEHDTIYLSGVYIDAYPSLPPKADPDHIVLHLSDGTTIWEKPNYGSEDCTDYMNCRRATLVLNPAWHQCSPQGIFYEVAAVDGRLLLESSFWEITDPATKASAYVAFACGQGFAGPNLTAISNQTAESGCLSQESASTPTGMTAAAAMALGAAYFSYRGAYDRTVYCVTNELSDTTSSTRCY
jgi:hypothetical protein